MLRRAVCLAVFLNQVLVPFAHEWRTAVAEAAYHSADASRTAAAVSKRPAAHRHHSAGDCELCLLVTGLAAPSAGASAAAAAPSSLAPLPDLSAPASGAEAAFLGRGPPAA